MLLQRHHLQLLLLFCLENFRNCSWCEHSSAPATTHSSLLGATHCALRLAATNIGCIRAPHNSSTSSTVRLWKHSHFHVSLLMIMLLFHACTLLLLKRIVSHLQHSTYTRAGCHKHLPQPARASNLQQKCSKRCPARHLT
jgi:hypothetical protein